MRRPVPTLALTLVTALSTAACGSANVVAGQGGSSEASGAHAGGGTGGAGAPAADGAGVTVRNCGRDVTTRGPLQRAVTTEQSATETLLALGLQDRMAGTSNIKTSVLPQWRAAYDKVPVLNPKILTPEQTLAARPDLVYSPYESLLAKDRSGTRDELAARGIATYLNESECPKGARTITDPIEAQLTDYRNLGRLFGVEARADRLVAEQRAAVAEARTHRPTGAAPRVLWIYSAYDGQPYVAGSAGLPSAMSRLLGGVNVFDDVDDHWPEVQWEQLAARNPDLIVVADLEERGRPGDAAKDKIAQLRSNPATAQMTAVKEGRFLAVPGVEMDTSVRWTRTLRQLRDELVRRGLVR